MLDIKRIKENPDAVKAGLKAKEAFKKHIWIDY